MNKALSLNHTRSQWVNLGIHTEACMTRPHTCGTAGGPVSLWMRVTYCPDFGGIVSSLSMDVKTGFSTRCTSSGIGYINLIHNTLLYFSSPFNIYLTAVNKVDVVLTATTTFSSFRFNQVRICEEIYVHNSCSSSILSSNLLLPQ